MPPISPTFDSNNGYGSQLDVNKAINAKFKEPVQKEYDNLGLTLTDNETEYVSSAYAITYNSTAVSIEIDDIEYSLGIPTDLDDLVLKLNDVLDIGIFYLDAYDDIIARGFHDFGDILQDGHAVFEPDIVAPLTNKATQSDINRELALRLASAGGGGTVTSITLSFADSSVSSIFDVNGGNSATITTSGSFGVTLNTQTANYVFAGPTTGAAAIPTFRALVLADIPSLSSLYWALNGNTVGSEKWIGTIDNFDFPIRTNNVQIAEFSTAGNLGIGTAPNASYRLHSQGSGTTNATVNLYAQNSDNSRSFAHYDNGMIVRNGSVYSIPAGYTSTSWGEGAGLAALSINTGGVYIGYYAGAGSTGSQVIVISGDSNNTSSGNYGTGTVAVGNGAIRVATGVYNSAYGSSAGKYSTTGVSNLYIGSYADVNDASDALSNKTGNYNIIIGANSNGTNTGTSFTGGNAFSSVWAVHGIGTASNQIVFGGGIADTYYTSLRVGYSSGGAIHGTYYRTSTPESAQTASRGSIAFVDTGAAGEVYIKATGTGNTGWLQLTTSSSGANTALSNLASVAINTTLLPGSNDGAALGSGTLSFSDLFLASGALINFANSDWIATHSTGILTVGTGDLRITTAGTNSASVVTVGGTQTLTNKSIVATQLTGTAYTFAANNTNATAAYTLHHYENHDLADYGGSFTWNSTPPSTIVTQKYAWSRIGNTVTLFISVLYTSAGTTNTTCAISMPSDCPNPAVFANSGDAASEYMYPINGARVEQTQTANPSAIRGGIRRNSGDTAFEISLIFGSTSALQLQVTVTYRTA